MYVADYPAESFLRDVYSLAQSAAVPSLWITLRHCGSDGTWRIFASYLFPVFMGSYYGRDLTCWFCEMFAITNLSGGLAQLIPQSEQKGGWHPDIDCSWTTLVCLGLPKASPGKEGGEPGAHQSSWSNAGERSTEREVVVWGCLLQAQRLLMSSSVHREGRLSLWYSEEEGERVWIC